jgi:uncharacterized protein (TIGR03083 family)
VKELEPLFCEGLLKQIDDQLLELAKDISNDDWNKETNYPNWKVRDVFSHIIDTSIRKLSNQRDHYFDTTSKTEIKSYHDLVQFIEKMADDWADSTRRISPQVLISLFSLIKNELYEFMKNQNHFDDSLFSVAWAGETTSKVWFDNAREYSEHWIHQEQIREALGYKVLDDKKYLKPILEIFLRAIPVAYKKRNEKVKIQIDVSGSFTENYFIEVGNNGYKIYDGINDVSDFEIKVDCLDLCRMLSRIIEPKELKYEIIGDIEKGKILEEAIAIMGQ